VKPASLKEFQECYSEFNTNFRTLRQKRFRKKFIETDKHNVMFDKIMKNVRVDVQFLMQ